MHKRYAARAGNAERERVVILKMPVVLAEFRASYAYMYALALIAPLILRHVGSTSFARALFYRSR